MSFVRHYVLTAKPGKSEELQSILSSLRAAVSSCIGILHVDLLQTRQSPDIFIFVEHWESQEVHATAARHMPPELINALKTTLSGPPQSTDLTSL